MLSVVAVLATFVACALLVRAALSDLNHRQTELRQARVARSLLLDLQLDEETGIRGYAATGDPRFLAPYFSARIRWHGLAQDLATSVASVAPATASLGAAELDINQQWNATVAKPVRADFRAGRQVPIEIHGKYLMDRFRSVDDQMLAILNQSSADLDTQAASLVGRIILISLGLAALVSVLIAVARTALIATLEEMRVKQQAYEDEKRITTALQQAFVQKDLPHLDDVFFDAVYTPAKNEERVGGDWYDAIEVSDGRILFSIGDVAGHGLQAAVDMNRVRQSIVTAGVSETDPGRVLTAVNRVVELQSSAFVTAICGYIEREGLNVSYASAGHPVPILAHRDGTTTMLDTGGTPLGAVSCVYTTSTVHARAEDLLVFYTDGAVEDQRDFERGERRLRDVVSEAARRRIRKAAQFIYGRIFRDGQPNDDVAILTARFAASRSKRASSSVTGSVESLSRAES
ncbi:MAG: PP2C family protein-serine/threonine phosphatase [Vulcanimicrobiaceae bacterium]